MRRKSSVIAQKLIFSFFLALTVWISVAQTSNYHSLDSLADYYSKNDLDQSILLRKQALEIARANQVDSQIYKCLNTLAVSMAEKGEYPKAISNFEEALSYASDLSDTVNTWAEMSSAYQALGENDKAASILLTSLEKTANQTGDLRISVLNEMGLFYRGIRESEKAIQYFRQIPDLMIASGNPRLHVPYINISLIFIDEDEFDSAIFYLEKAYPYIIKQNGTYSLAIYHNNMGAIFNDMGDESAALPHALKALELKKELGLTQRLANTYNLLAHIYLGLRDFENAEANASIALSLQDSASADNVKHNSLRYLIYSKLGSKGLDDVRYLLEDLEDLNFNRFEQEKAQSFAEAEAKYEVTQKESRLKIQEIELAQKATQRNLLMGGIGFLIIVSLLIFRSQRIKTKANKELAKKNDQIKELEQLKTRWFTNIAHELRTPLTLISGPLDKVLSEENVNAVGKEDLLLMKRNVNQLSGIVSEILDITKIEEGSLELTLSTFDLTQLVKPSVMAFESNARLKGVQLKVEASESYLIEADEEKLRKAVTNLVSNALRFTHRGGEIVVTLNQTEQGICIEVKDTGEGISDEDQQHIFDRFYQTNDKTKERRGGTGIGLSLVKEIVTMHGGEVLLESEPGQGSCFTICLPESLIRSEALEDGQTDQMEDDEIQNKYTLRTDDRPTVLLVEDNDDMREFIRSILQTECALHESVDGMDALEFLKDQQPDLIISDIMMPRMDGVELAKKVKASPDCSEIPFITLTALDSDDDRLHTLRIGIDDYITKPFNGEELKVRVTNLLKNRSARQQTEAKDDLSFDDELLVKLENEVRANLTEDFLTVSYLADKVAMSERNLRRYLKKVSGLSPAEFILEIKLQTALRLLEKKKYPTLKEVALHCGFDRGARFSASFEKRFGKKPSDFFL